MAVSTVGARHVILFLQVGTDSGRDRFLSDVKMNESRHYSGSVSFLELQLKRTLPQHAPV
jgi:hypothetical protein